MKEQGGKFSLSTKDSLTKIVLKVYNEGLFLLSPHFAIDYVRL